MLEDSVDHLATTSSSCSTPVRAPQLECKALAGHRQERAFLSNGRKLLLPNLYAANDGDAGTTRSDATCEIPDRLGAGGRRGFGAGGSPRKGAQEPGARATRRGGAPSGGVAPARDR